MKYLKNKSAPILTGFHYLILKVFTFLFPALARSILIQCKVKVIDKQAIESGISASRGTAGGPRKHGGPAKLCRLRNRHSVTDT